MNFKATFCDPFKPDIVQLGDVSPDSIVETFENVSWSDFLRRMKSTPEEEIYFSPSLEIVNKDTNHGLAISAVGESDSFEFDVFYKRPKKVSKLFGLIENVNNHYITDITGQTRDNVLDLLSALKRGDTDYLARKIGE